jgi:poly-beta-1,6-N-acetyl-D-glucosamine synthase
MRLLFWASALTIGYVYVGYPLLLAVWAGIVGRDGREGRDRLEGRDDRLSGVSIVLAARNEAHRLAARIENLLALDYPADRRQIIVVSDGSTDRTLEALAVFGGQIDIVAVPFGGKALALNAGVARASHPILVFTDARQVFAADALRALVAPFCDATVGGVTGALMLDRESAGSTIADGISLYWNYETQLRRLESTIGSTLGATGAIYALRRSLWRDLPADTLLDDVLAPMRAVLAGHRVVFEERAKAYDRTPPDSQAESRRKIRTLAGNVQILWLEPRLLIPFINPVWLQYYSHKLGRLAVPYALLAWLTASIALAGEGAFYAAALAGQCGFYLLAGYGAYLEWRDDNRAHATATDSVPANLDKGVVNA